MTRMATRRHAGDRRDGERAYGSCSKDREIRRNIGALSATERGVHYVALDVREDERSAISSTRSTSSYGRIVRRHSRAGVIEDKLVRDSPIDSLPRACSERKH